MPSLAEFLQMQKQFNDQPTALDYYGDIAKASMIPDEINMKGLEARQKFEDYENTQKLRKLFAESQGMPGIAEVGQYSPDMAIKLQQAMLDNAVKQQQMQESGMRTGRMGQEMQLEKGKAFANAIGPYGDQYYMDIQSGMPEGQALNKFRMSTGQALQQLEQQGLSPDTPFDMNALTPDAALRAASGHGYRSQYLESQQKIGEESAMRGLPPAPTPQQAYGGYHTTPEGYNVQIPPVIGQPPQPSAPFAPIDESGPPTVGQGENNIDFLRQTAQSLPKGSKERRAVEDELAQEIKRVVGLRQPSQAMPGGVVTPDQLRQERLKEKQAESDIRVSEEGQKTAAKEREIGRAEAEDKLATIAAMPNDAEIKRLLDASISGSPEALLKGPIATALHIENKAQTATTVLDALHEFVKALGTKAKGDLNAQEVKNFDKAVGALGDSNLNPNSRFAAYLNAKNTIARKIGVKYPDLHTKYLKGKYGKKSEQPVQENDSDASYNDPDEDEKVDAILKRHGIK